MVSDVLPVLSVERPVLVARLLELKAAGALASAHVRAGAQVAGVNVRTVWRWLETAEAEGRFERRPRRGFVITDEQWDVLGRAGGSVAVLHRHLKATAGEGARVPSLATLYRVVHRDLEAGRVLPEREADARAQVRMERALTDLALAGRAEDAAAGPERGGAGYAPSPAGRTVPGAGSGQPGRSVGRPGVVAGVVLAAGAALVRTEAVGAVAQALGSAVAGAGQGIACVYGDTGRGKTVALRAAVAGLPAGFEAAWVMTPVRPSLAELRRAVFDALGLAGRFPQRSAQADALIVEALAEPWVLVVDEGQRLPVPCLQYLQGLFDHLGTRVTLVLCGAGVERAVVRLPQLASRVSAWQEVPRLPAARVPEVMGDFHPLWRTVSAKDLRWIDGACARGGFRAWSALTVHLQNALLTVPDAQVDRTVLRRLFRRVGPPL
ncbi:ATP-binding protein [Streptacidiphilus melanogenes]|uniref:ATP-binding protein n=1 Tax=Streptacidiphilus melanogenes TaxID=411235 RepID=UPI0005A960FC|nr:ATP-binding protein [Streptacidiphilus melanogenes]